ncbi:hypothetical protein K239x_16880 [Planctomycetes bacterium K23_9]|uniref:Uncharacterized protein n=1 Tax=Stieleria marina TaxID=1930275 RepID=A0A517NRG9_9BACT|nr:hypothetical protein K239x_16880 [Planctomycetes bacterium K23_9]
MVEYCRSKRGFGTDLAGDSQENAACRTAKSGSALAGPFRPPFHLPPILRLSETFFRQGKLNSQDPPSGRSVPTYRSPLSRFTPNASNQLASDGT